MERLTSPLRKLGKPKYMGDQQSALLVLQTYMKARAQAKQLQTSSSPRKDLRPMESLKRLLPKRRASRVMKSVTRSPILTNGILIRNKKGELLNPPSNTPAAGLRATQMKSLSSQMPSSPCTQKTRFTRRWEDSAEDRMVDVPCTIQQEKNQTAELSSAEYSKDPDTFYVRDTLKDRTIDGAEDMPTSPQDTKPFSQIKTVPDQDKSLCYMSMISKASELTMREQPSAMINMSGAGVLHSTLQYPLHSTMMPDPHLQSLLIPDMDHSDSDCNSSTLSFDVDQSSLSKSGPEPAKSAVEAGAACDVCRPSLRRQTAHCQLQQRRLPQSLTQSDLLHDRTLLLNHSLNGTRGSEADLHDLTLVNQEEEQSDSSRSTLLSTDCLHLPLYGDDHGCPDCSHESKKSRHSTAGSRSHPYSSSSSSSSLNLSKDRKKELGRRLKQFNRSINSQRRNLEITTLGVF